MASQPQEVFSERPPPHLPINHGIFRDPKLLRQLPDKKPFLHPEVPNIFRTVFGALDKERWSLLAIPEALVVWLREGGMPLKANLSPPPKTLWTAG